MSLYLLVEGDCTEPRIYRAWIEHTFPGLTAADRVDRIGPSSYFIFRGNGYPSCLRRIGNALADIRDHARVDHFFVCVDAEERSYDERIAEVQAALEEQARQTGVLSTVPHLTCHVIVQHCCIETWLLGHARMLRRNPESTRLVEMKAFHDVSTDDPEQMGRPTGYLTRASFHLTYLQEMLREQGKSYTKKNPGVVLEPNYLQALRQRCASTGHLASLQRLFTAWDGVVPANAAG